MLSYNWLKKQLLFLYLNILQDEIERKGSILVDFKELTNDEEIAKLIPNVANELRDTPEKTLACMGLAIHQVNIHFVRLLSTF